MISERARIAAVDRVESEGGLADPVFLCVMRLAEVVRLETQLLKAGGAVDFDALNRRKSHALMEFTQVARGVTDAPQLVAQISELRLLLAENAEILDRRLQATREIAMLILEQARKSESDGTYTMTSHGGGRK